MTCCFFCLGISFAQADIEPERTDSLHMIEFEEQTDTLSIMLQQTSNEHDEQIRLMRKLMDHIEQIRPGVIVGKKED